MPDSEASLDPVQLGAYFTLIEVVGLLRHAVERQLREAGGLSYVQFQLLARLGDAPAGSHRMTDLADGVVYSRSALTYQAGLLEKAGLVTRAPAPDDERGTTVTITDAGRERLAQVFPGHIELVSHPLFEPLSPPAAGRGRLPQVSPAHMNWVTPLLCEPLSPADVKALADLLEPVRDHMRATPPRSAQRRRKRAQPDAGNSSMP